MNQLFPFSQFKTRFANENLCLDEIKKYRYPNGIFCEKCNKVTKHYKLQNRLAYSCKFCRNQVYPLAGTIFEKSTTPLTLWFYALFLMTHTRADISIIQLQRELGVTYKTAWRIYTSLKILMEKNNGDLLKGKIEFDETFNEEKSKVRRWTFFDKIEFKVVQKKDSSR